MMAQKYLIVGLGNPGPKYTNTRHNAGVRVIKELVSRYCNDDEGVDEQKARTWVAAINGEYVKFASPTTFMNRSGEALWSLMRQDDIPLENLLVVYDDLDTPFGAIRMRKSGGDGGQNGMRSVQDRLDTKNIARLRFGIGRPPGRMEPSEYVLQDFQDDDDICANELAGRAADAIEVWLSEGIESAMSKFNGKA